jgi:RNA polymerase sigma factor (sigma-70 family)
MPDELREHARRAAAGDRQAARALLDAIQDDVYALALRMLGHPADAEDAAQEALIIVLTHLGEFRGDSGLKTWVYRIAANHLLRVKRGRRETMSFELLDERLRSGLSVALTDPEEEALARELRLRCTQAMLLSLDREHRVAYVLGDIFELPGEQAAAVLEISPAAFRKRLSRARTRLYDFVRGWCGVYDANNPCRCEKQVACAVERGILERGDLALSSQRIAPRLERAAGEVTEMFRVAQVLRGPGNALAPEALVVGLRKLFDSARLQLLTD